MAPLPVFYRPLDSTASSRRTVNEGNSSGNSGSGGSVNIGPASVPTSRTNTGASDYLGKNMNHHINTAQFNKVENFFDHTDIHRKGGY